MDTTCFWCGKLIAGTYWHVPTKGDVCSQKCYFDCCSANGINPNPPQRTGYSNFKCKSLSWKIFFEESGPPVSYKMSIGLNFLVFNDAWLKSGAISCHLYHSPTTQFDYKTAVPIKAYKVGYNPFTKRFEEDEPTEIDFYFPWQYQHEYNTKGDVSDLVSINFDVFDNKNKHIKKAHNKFMELMPKDHYLILTLEEESVDRTQRGLRMYWSAKAPGLVDLAESAPTYIAPSQSAAPKPAAPAPKPATPAPAPKPAVSTPAPAPAATEKQISSQFVDLSVSAPGAKLIISGLSSNANIAITGEMTQEILEDIVKTMEMLDSRIRISLDLSATKGLTEINDFCFKGIGQLLSLKLPDSITTIGQSAFQESGITEIEIPSSVKTIASWAFAESKLKNIILNEGLETIGGYSFNKAALESIELPKSLREIDESAFSDCSNLQIVKLSEGIEKIGPSAFLFCPLKQLELPASLNVLGFYPVDDNVPLSFKRNSDWYAINPMDLASSKLKDAIYTAWNEKDRVNESELLQKVREYLTFFNKQTQ